MSTPRPNGFRLRPTGFPFQPNGFRLLWLGDTVNALGTSLTLFVLPIIAVTALHANALQIGLLTTGRWLPTLLIGLPAGAWAERREKRRVLLSCNLASAVVIATVPISGALGALSMAQLYAVVAVAGALDAVFNAAYSPYISTVLPPAEYRRGMSRIRAARTAAQLCGPALGGLLATRYGPSAAILADAGSFALSFACLSRLPRAAPVTDPAAPAADPAAPAVHEAAAPTLTRDIRDGLRYLRREPYLRRLTVIAAAENLLTVGFGAVQVIFLLQAVHATPRIAGYLLALGAIGSLLGAVIAPRVSTALGEVGAMRCYLLVLMPVSTLICLTSQGPRYAFFVAGELTMAIAVTGFTVIVLAFRQRRVPNSMLARASATMGVFLTSTTPLGGVLGGLLADAAGVRNALWVILPCTAAPGLLLLRRPFIGIRDLPP